MVFKVKRLGKLVSTIRASAHPQNGDITRYPVTEGEETIVLIFVIIVKVHYGRRVKSARGSQSDGWRRPSDGHRQNSIYMRTCQTRYSSVSLHVFIYYPFCYCWNDKAIAEGNKVVCIVNCIVNRKSVTMRWNDKVCDITKSKLRMNKGRIYMYLISNY